MLFWIITGVLAVLVSGIIGFALLRGRVGEKPPAAYDLQVYRDQLKEVDRDLARGVIGPEDAERTRAEISRRVLTADAQLKRDEETAGKPRRSSALIAFGLMVVMTAGAFGLYTQIGAPGMGDLPLKARMAASEAERANRMTQTEAEAQIPATDITPDVSEDFLRLMAQLRQTVKDRPGDLRGLTLLAQNESALGNYTAAYEAQQKIIDTKGDAAPASDYANLAELKISAAGGYVSQQAEDALRAALERDPQTPVARYYMGIYLMQVDRPDAAFRTWDSLLRQSRPDAPWVAPIRARIEELAWRAGLTDYELPEAPQGTAPAQTPPVSGPSAADIDAAGDMSAADRQQMVQGMVQGLSQRLATEGGTSAEWSQLIRALGVLGDTEQAATIWAEAQGVFAEQPEALQQVRAAARAAGVAE